MNAVAKFDTLQAAADYLGNGAIEINKYESEIVDYVRRNSVFLTRVRKPKATGHPHRYFEQLAIAAGQFTDPRALQTNPSGPTRVERGAMIKAVVAQTNVTLFDVDVTRQQGNFAEVEAKDINDITNAVIVAEASGVWTGNDTNLVAPSSVQYVGLLEQITQQSTIGPGVSIIDALKAEVAAMVARTDFVVRPTAIYMNPILADFIEREAKGQKLTSGDVQVGGVSVPSIMTQAGKLPLITDPWLAAATNAQFGFAAPAAGLSNFFAVIVTEDMIEMPYISGATDNPNPRLFQLGLVAGLQGQYVAVHFNTIIAKGATYAHAVIAIQRPTFAN